MTFSPAEWWGSHGCRYADDPTHTCLDLDGRPLAGGRVCASEARAACRDMLDRYRAMAS